MCWAIDSAVIQPWMLLTASSRLLASAVIVWPQLQVIE
jgi:hypothetical protein